MNPERPEWMTGIDISETGDTVTLELWSIGLNGSVTGRRDSRDHHTEITTSRVIGRSISDDGSIIVKTASGSIYKLGERMWK